MLPHIPCPSIQLFSGGFLLNFATNLFAQSAELEAWEALAGDFRRFHKNSVNVALHAATTPLGLIGFLALVRSTPEFRSCASTNQ